MKQKNRKRLTAVDLFFFLGAALISVSLGLWLRAEAGMLSGGVFCLLTSWLSSPHDNRRTGDDSA